MNTYFVRVIENQRVVGIIAAESSVQLFDVVDEDLDPFSCEYFKLEPGEGLFFDGQFTFEPDEEDRRRRPWVGIEPMPEGKDAGMHFSEALAQGVNEAKRRWKKFTETDYRQAYGFGPKSKTSSEKVAVIGMLMGINVPLQGDDLASKAS